MVIKHTLGYVLSRKSILTQIQEIPGYSIRQSTSTGTDILFSGKLYAKCFKSTSSTNSWSWRMRESIGIVNLEETTAR